MNKEELIKLLKEHKEKSAKLKLRKAEKRMYDKQKKGTIEIESSITSTLGVNQGIHSRNKISKKTEEAAINSIDRTQEMRKEAEEKIKELEKEIEKLEEVVEEGNTRLEALYYKEREILTAYYVDNREAEEIGRNLYFKLYNRTCTADNIYKIVKRGTDIMLRL